MSVRLAFAGAALLAFVPGGLSAQSAPVAEQAPAPAPATALTTQRAPQVGDNPADVPEILEAVDLCRKATHKGAVFEYRMLREAGYKIGSRTWKPAEKKDDRGELVMAFGKGNTAIFVRHGAVLASCRVIVHVASPAVADKLRGEMISRKFAQTFESSTDKTLKDAMLKIFPADYVAKIMIGPEHYYEVFLSNRSGRDLLSVTVYSSVKPS